MEEDGPLDADRAQSFKFRSDSVRRAVQGARLSLAGRAGRGRDVRLIAAARMPR